MVSTRVGAHQRRDTKILILNNKHKHLYTCYLNDLLPGDLVVPKTNMFLNKTTLCVSMFDDVLTFILVGMDEIIIYTTERTGVLVSYHNVFLVNGGLECYE
jgi:hypothetical protein